MYEWLDDFMTLEEKVFCNCWCHAAFFHLKILMLIILILPISRFELYQIHIHIDDIQIILTTTYSDDISHPHRTGHKSPPLTNKSSSLPSAYQTSCHSVTLLFADSQLIRDSDQR